MTYPFSPQIQQLINQKMASGAFVSEEALLLAALRSLDDYEASLADIRAGIDDEAAGRTRPLAEIDAEIRRELGFAS